MRLIRKKGHHYLAQVKANQKKLLEWIDFLQRVDPSPIQSHTEIDHNTHGRYEYRRYDLFDDLYGLEKEWKDLRYIIRVTSGSYREREKSCRLERLFYITSFPGEVKQIARIVRRHWGIENSLHYVKDVSFNEDHSRMRSDQIPFVATILRSLAINVLNAHHFSNLKQMKKVFAWEPERLFCLFGA